MLGVAKEMPCGTSPAGQSGNGVMSSRLEGIDTPSGAATPHSNADDVAFTLTIG